MKSWQRPTVDTIEGKGRTPVVFDSRLGRLQRLDEDQQASLYVCGITPYDATHMGHAATYVAFDLLQRAWLDAGHEVHYVQNVTDVDDPLIERAEATGVDWQDLATDQTDLFREDMTALSVIPPEQYVGATESVDWIVPWVQEMLANGTAYTAPGYTDAEGTVHPAGDVYFDVRAARDTEHQPSRWFLGYESGYTEEEMAPLFAERGGDPQRPGKKDPFDALLWRAHRAGEPAWDGGSLGPGRPGWHIECTVIGHRFLGIPFTVQGGGSDLRFPHHEMGAGHAYAMTDQEMARHYVHTGMVGLDGEKMSKSKGNLVLVSTLRRAGVEPAAIRLAILANHYRSDWFWTEDLLETSQQRLAAWRHAVASAAAGEPDEATRDLVAGVREAVADDLDAPRALGLVDAWAAQDPASRTGAQQVRALVQGLLGVQL